MVALNLRSFLGGLFVFHPEKGEGIDATLKAQKMGETKAKVAAFATSVFALILRSPWLATATVFLIGGAIVLEDLRAMNFYVKNEEGKGMMASLLPTLTTPDLKEKFREVALKAETTVLRYLPKEWMAKSLFVSAQGI